MPDVSLTIDFFKTKILLYIATEKDIPKCINGVMHYGKKDNKIYFYNRKLKR